MLFNETDLAGVYVIDVERHADERGFFGRTWSKDEASSRGIVGDIAQCSISFNRISGTLRGLHYQVSQAAEAKLVRCTRGAVFDVAVDVRPDSSTRGRWIAVELTAENRRSLYIPEHCAHGFQTLSDETEVFYQISRRFSPEHQAGIVWNDPTLAITWPLAVTVISERDLALPLFNL